MVLALSLAHIPLPYMRLSPATTATAFDPCQLSSVRQRRVAQAAGLQVRADRFNGRDREPEGLGYLAAPRWMPREEQEDEHVQIAQVTPRGTFDMRHLFNGGSPDMLRVQG
jgi:hypothetical protein